MLLTAAQMDELRSSIAAWHRDNPIGRAVPFIHLEDFAFATSANARRPQLLDQHLLVPRHRSAEQPRSRGARARAVAPACRAGGLLRPACAQAHQHGDAAPGVRNGHDPGIRAGCSHSVDRIGGAAQATGNLAADLPRLFAEERSAAIEQLTGILDERQGELQALVVELRSTLEAGGTTSDSVRETIAALDVLLARFDRPASATARS